MKAKRVGNRLLADVAPPRDGEEREGEEREGQGAGGAAAYRPIRSRRIRKVSRSVVKNLAESPLGWLLARGHVSERQFAAGEQLRADWERAQLAPRVTMDYEGTPSSRTARGAPTPSDPTTAQIAARRRFDAAIAEVGPGLTDILWRLVCSGEAMRDAEQALGWPARAGKLVLVMALDRLAGFYRLR
ncbi:MAG TPA: DUF6456 domain-containing protein [Allosphingosinicella sp.]|jgi:hypothetical protein